jgi:hypothetical protein
MQRLLDGFYDLGPVDRDGEIVADILDITRAGKKHEQVGLRPFDDQPTTQVPALRPFVVKPWTPTPALREPPTRQAHFAPGLLAPGPVVRMRATSSATWAA